MSNDSLSELLCKLDAIDDDLLPEEFDPAELVGDIRNKVDAIKWRIDTWVASAKMIDEEYIKLLQQKRQSILGKVDRLKDYVQDQLNIHNVQKLPGKMFRVQLQNSPKSIETKDFANANYFLNYPEYVKQYVSYEWIKDALKVAIEHGEVLIFAELKQSKHIRFYAQGGSNE